MKTLNLLRIVVMAALMCGLSGCSSNDGGGTVFIPGFNATWPVEGDDNYEIDLQPDEDNQNVHAGVFNGRELHQDPDDPRHDNLLSGSFNGLDIEFTIQRPGNQTIKYTGKMMPTSETNHFIIKIELHSSEGNIVLSR